MSILLLQGLFYIDLEIENGKIDEERGRIHI